LQAAFAVDQALSPQILGSFHKPQNVRLEAAKLKQHNARGFVPELFGGRRTPARC
jgi:hypothetical protein